jgi:hypothetical protein
LDLLEGNLLALDGAGQKAATRQEARETLK